MPGTPPVFLYCRLTSGEPTSAHTGVLLRLWVFKIIMGEKRLIIQAKQRQTLVLNSQKPVTDTSGNITSVPVRVLTAAVVLS